MASFQPPQAWPGSLSVQVMLELCQSPVMYGTMMNTASGIISSAPVMYATQTAGLIPKMLKIQTSTITPAPMMCGSPMPSAVPVLNVQSCPGNHCETTSEPTTMPKIDSTVDHANQ